MSPRLQLRRGIVVAEEPLTVEVDGERRPAWADIALLGEMREGDEVVVNVAALELGLGSGGFDIVHVNLTRGLDAAPGGDEHVIKLNYTSLQHPVEPGRGRRRREFRPLSTEKGRKRGHPFALRALVLPLHGHLAPAAWALAQGEALAEGEVEEEPPRVGYVQTAGGALPGSLSRDVVELRERGLLAGHITVAPSYGGEHEAISVAGALDAAGRLGWEAALVGPGPGIIGSDSELGHGGMAALDSARRPSRRYGPGDDDRAVSPRPTRESAVNVQPPHLTVLRVLLAPVDVAVPEGEAEVVAALEGAAGSHRLCLAPADLDGYEASGLPASTMGRSLREDPLFFAAPLAAGAALRRKG